jgi:hypothetical protein
MSAPHNELILEIRRCDVGDRFRRGCGGRANKIGTPPVRKCRTAFDMHVLSRPALSERQVEALVKISLKPRNEGGHELALSP